MNTLESAISNVIQSTYKVDTKVVLTRPEPQFGDFATNIALQLAKQVGQNPRELAAELAEKILSSLGDTVSNVTVAGPGFINLRLSDAALLQSLEVSTDITQSLAGKTVVAEYSDPNPFKILHAGHLYSSVVGDAIANLLAAAGATVHRVNFGGDVGLHVGKTMWAMLQSLGGENPEGLLKYQTSDERNQWLSDCYIAGTNAYEDDESAKVEIVSLNKKIYALHSENDHESALAHIYWTTRQWSYDYFDDFYESIGTSFEKYYPESEVAELGLQTVKDHMQSGIFEESDGAVVFKGEPYGLHTRVFINREGLPTYEAKDVGLIFAKKQEYNFDKSVVITGNEQAQYMAVVLKAIEQFEPDLVHATAHLTHGLVKLEGGVKMSSRKGNILRAVDVLQSASQANQKATGKHDASVELGAVKYSFLKVRTGGDIIYNPEDSVSLEGNSGPYLQYAHARAQSILSKSTNPVQGLPAQIEESDRQLVSKLTQYSEVTNKAIQELAPHIVCTYLYELAQEFNRFYENNRVIGDPRAKERLQLVALYANILKQGLALLGIDAPDKM